jgi:NAD(P)-dependent dehydrogenase (short-subunit alcohol dehydrogenase family)
VTEPREGASALAGKVAVITGAGSGVGRASARLFAREGAKVVCAELRDEWAAETIRLIEAEDGLPGAAIAVHCDVSDEEQVKNAVDTARSSFGRIDIMFNNTGVAGSMDLPRTIDATTPELYDLLMNVNFKGTYHGCKHAVIAFQQQGGGGAIVNTASAAGLVAWGHAVYGASKGAVIALTRTLAVEQAKHDIRVNCTAPGAINTNFGRKESDAFTERPQEELDWLANFQPLGRYITGMDVAQASLFLASDAASNITGVVLPVDGGHIAV